MLDYIDKLTAYPPQACAPPRTEERPKVEQVGSAAAAEEGKAEAVEPA